MRRGALLADLPEVRDVFRRQRVFHEEQLELFRVLAELHRLVGRHALVHVVQQFDLLAQLLAADFEQLQRAADVGRRLEDRFVVQRLDGSASPLRRRRSLPCPARPPARAHCGSPAP